MVTTAKPFGWLLERNVKRLDYYNTSAGFVTGTFFMETVMNKDVVFQFLNDIRESGKINMFGAGPYVQEVFGVDRYEANELVKEWMMSFQKRGV